MIYTFSRSFLGVCSETSFSHVFYFPLVRCVVACALSVVVDTHIVVACTLSSVAGHIWVKGTLIGKAFTSAKKVFFAFRSVIQ